MKKLLLFLLLLQVGLFAQTGLLGGRTGLHQQDANTLGAWHFRAGTGGTIATDQFGYTRGGRFVDSKGNWQKFDQWDANMSEGRIDGALAGNFNFAFGLREDLDLGISLPIYYDHAKDYTGEAAPAGMIEGGLGDLQLYGKWRTPHYFGPDYMRTAVVLDLWLPTGWKNVGMRPRHAWFLNSDSDGPTYAYTANSVVAGLTGVIELDYTKIGIPIWWNSSVGFVAVFGDGSNTLVYSTGVNWVLHEYFQPFLEFSGEMRIGGNDYPINPLVDPMLLTPGFNFKVFFLDFLGDIQFSGGLDIGIRNLTNAGYSMSKEMDGCEDFMLNHKGEDGSRHSYCYVAHPLIAGIAKLTWTFGHKPVGDDDGDGVNNDNDKCPHTPKPIVVDRDGCGIDSDKDGVFDGKDKCPNTPQGVEVNVEGCPLDTDEDGVYDYRDQCPNTPKGVKVDTLGCPLDSDKDGVYDYRDQCPNTPEGVKVDTVGCPLDSDKDKVPDYKDQCPDTPEGAPVDTVGCPLDTDKDGVFDYKDECPNTLPGIEVDSRGCPLEKKKDLDQLKKGINFEFNSSKLTNSSYPTLDLIVALMKEIPEANVEVQGHTDIIGTEDYNQKLSEQRAETVTKYLIKKGIAKDRLRAVGFGTRRPLADNESDEGRAKNRRVELIPFDKDGQGDAGFTEQMDKSVNLERTPGAAPTTAKPATEPAPAPAAQPAPAAAPAAPAAQPAPAPAPAKAEAPKPEAKAPEAAKPATEAKPAPAQKPAAAPAPQPAAAKQ